MNNRKVVGKLTLLTHRLFVLKKRFWTWVYSEILHPVQFKQINKKLIEDYVMFQVFICYEN